MRPIVIAVVLFSTLVAIADTPSTTDELTTAVTLMARIGHCGSPGFSPEHLHVRFCVRDWPGQLIRCVRQDETL
jgi:hypothetical protein